MIWAFDPGDTTGVVVLDPEANYRPIRTENVGLQSLYAMLSTVPVPQIPKLVIIEEYKVFPHMFTAHAHSDIPALQVIGTIKYWAYLYGCRVVMQPPNIKQMGFKYLAVPPPKNHSYGHFMDAYAHATYYLVTKKIIPNPALKHIDKAREDKLKGPAS